MSIAYTGLAQGTELATVAVALSFVLAVFAVPLWMMFFASHYTVNVPLRDMLMSILTVLIAPMTLGYLTRRMLVKRQGKSGFKSCSRFSRPCPPSAVLTGLVDFLRQGDGDCRKMADGAPALDTQRPFRWVDASRRDVAESPLALVLSRAYGRGLRQHGQEQRNGHRNCRDGFFTPGGGTGCNDADLSNPFSCLVSEGRSPYQAFFRRLAHGWSSFSRRAPCGMRRFDGFLRNRRGICHEATRRARVGIARFFSRSRSTMSRGHEHNAGR